MKTAIVTGASTSMRGRRDFGAFNSSKGLPDYATKLGDQGMIDLEDLVDTYEYLYMQPRTAWSFEVDVRTSLERR